MTSHRKRTQGENLAAALKKIPHTYMEMLGYGISVAPWMRVREWVEQHPEWQIVKGKHRGLVTWKLAKVKK